jgi:hypothetical protein
MAAVSILVLLVSVLLGLVLWLTGTPVLLAIGLGCVPIGWLVVFLLVAPGISF